MYYQILSSSLLSFSPILHYAGEQVLPTLLLGFLLNIVTFVVTTLKVPMKERQPKTKKERRLKKKICEFTPFLFVFPCYNCLLFSKFSIHALHPRDSRWRAKTSRAETNRNTVMGRNPLCVWIVSRGKLQRQQQFSLLWFNTYSHFLIQNDNHNLIVGISAAQL